MAIAEFYYCLDHRAVEPYEGCKSAERLGPYPTREDAAHALETLHARNDALDAEAAAEEKAEVEDREKFGGPFGF